MGAIISIKDQRTQREIFGSALPKVESRPYFFKEAVIRNTMGQTLLVDGSGHADPREGGYSSEGYLVTLRDVTEIKRMSETIDYQASHDSAHGPGEPRGVLVHARRIAVGR